MVNREKTKLQIVYDEIRNTLGKITEDADFEAKELLQAVCGVSRQDLMLGRDVPVSEEQQRKLNEMVRRRMERYPLQYLLGEWDFFGRRFFVGEGVLIPRSDTEPLVEACLELLKGVEKPRMLDLCAGSGCIGITLQLERPDGEVWAVEKSLEAWKFFQKNNAAYGGKVHGILGDALDLNAVAGELDLIVSNPPYLTGAEMAALQPEVAYEPAMALYGEDDGLFFYRELSKKWASRLKKGSVMAFEVGDAQGEEVAGIFRDAGFDSICQKRDLHGIIRVVSAKRPLEG